MSAAKDRPLPARRRPLSRSLCALSLSVLVEWGLSKAALAKDHPARWRQRADIGETCRQQAASKLDARSLILAAIQNGLIEQKVSNSPSLRAQDLEVQVLLSSETPDSGIELTGLEYDRFRKETLFRLSRPSDTRSLPFLVMAKWRPEYSEGEAAPADQAESVSAANHSGSLIITSAQGGQKRANHIGLPLVFPGRALLMVSQGQHYRTIRAVIPLERGNQGQHIRVRDPVTRQVLAAEVLKAGLLRQVW